MIKNIGQAIMFVLLISSNVVAQQLNYPIFSIPLELKTNANSVIRFEEDIITIPDQKTQIVQRKRVISVLNSNGDRHVDTYMHYDPVTRIKKIGAYVYNALGIKIKEYKKRDFRDVSAVDGISLFTDSRLLYIDHKATSYPYTIEFFVDIETDNTAFIGSWYGSSDYYVSTEKSVYSITYEPSLKLKYNAFDEAQVFSKKEEIGYLRLESSNIEAMVPEDFSPALNTTAAHYDFALENFHLEGVDGSAKNWQEFGAWMDINLVKESQDLSQQTKYEVLKLISEETNDIDKARKIYEYVQNKTRYISVQVGIGGWKPMLASEVDKLGYGDCKALTNYTKSLLDVAEIPSYYTILYAGGTKRDILPDFASVQGNHAILAIPEGDDFVWLECTSQKIPFGFIGDFTDDRDVMVLTPEGGKIVHTKVYDYGENTQKLMGDVFLNEDGSIQAEVEIESKGIQYNDRYLVADQIESDQKKYYYNFWDNINNLKISSIVIENNTQEVVVNEKIDFTAERYASFAGSEMLVCLNALNTSSQIPSRYKNRAFDVEIQRGFVDTDAVVIHLPEGFSLEGIPEPIHIENDFGAYDVAVERIDDHSLKYNRMYTIYGGKYPKEKYKEFRSFLKKVARHDNQKIILTKN